MNETPAAPDYLADVEALRELVGKGRELVEAGNTVDMTNLQEEVSRICASIQELPPVDPIAVTEAIEGLVIDLSSLAELLASQQAPSAGDN